MNLLLALVLAGAGVAMSARILAVLPIPARSHHIMFRAVLRTLAEAGHQVVCYSGMPADTEVETANLTVIHLSNIQPTEKTNLMQTTMALTFSNAHPYAHYSQPYTPNIIPIGGIHLAEKQKPLPAEMKQFLDDSPEGVIYFSLGSIMPDNLLDDEYFNGFLKAFSKLQQRVLWKTKRDLQNLPKNIMVSKWVPQQDVLAHPRVKVFITHGGLFSQHEAMNAGVPVVCIPLFGDQPMNARFYEQKGIGVVLPFNTLSEQTILAALKKVLNDPKYKENSARLSLIYRDRPLSPQQSILFWTDYVLRHQGARHLTPSAAAMSLYQLYMLDVAALLISPLLIVVVLTVICLRRRYIKIKRE